MKTISGTFWTSVNVIKRDQLLSKVLQSDDHLNYGNKNVVMELYQVYYIFVPINVLD